MSSFIYVYNKEARDKLIEANFTLLQEDKVTNTYVFLLTDKNGVLRFDNLQNLNISYILSNTLTL